MRQQESHLREAELRLALTQLYVGRRGPWCSWDPREAGSGNQMREGDGAPEGAGSQERAAGRATQRCGRTGGRRCLGPPDLHIPSCSARRSPHNRHCSAAAFHLCSFVLAGATAADVRCCHAWAKAVRHSDCIFDLNRLNSNVRCVRMRLLQHVCHMHHKCICIERFYRPSLNETDMLPMPVLPNATSNISSLANPPCKRQ